MKKVTNGNNYKRLKVQLVLGNPRIGCDGYGICKFITKAEEIKLIYPDRLIEAHLFIENGHLEIIFNKSKMVQAIYQTHFSEGIFKIETLTELPKTIYDLFEIPPSVLECGVYKIVENASRIRVEISLYNLNESMICDKNRIKNSFFFTIKGNSHNEIILKPSF